MESQSKSFGGFGWMTVGAWAAALAGTAMLVPQRGVGLDGSRAERASWSNAADSESPSLDRARALIEAQAFGMLPADQQQKVMAAGLYTPPTAAPCDGDSSAPGAEIAPLGDEGYAAVRGVVTRDAFDRLAPVHQRAVAHIVAMRAAGQVPPSMCFAPGTPEVVVQAFGAASAAPFQGRFEVGGAWTYTATNGSTAGQNRPITLTYSFVPDGTIVPTLVNTTQPSNLFARMNTIYNTTDPSVWQAVYAQIFARWSQVTGVRYVYEPHDDGVALGAAGSSGQIGVRGDCRFSGTALDGDYNVLAFNYFPGGGIGGDCVLDTNDVFFADRSSNSIRLRNTLAHEHGHGLGLNHVCPTNQTKLMEPYISLSYDGPQIDDILGAQRDYGDIYEPNDTSATATNITDLTVGQARTISNLSVNGFADEDWFRFTMPQSGTATITVAPLGGSYLEGAQAGGSGCTAGTTYNAATINTLNVTIYGANGATVMNAAAAAQTGQSVSAQAVLPAGMFYARVFGGRVTDSIQGYSMTYSATATVAATGACCAASVCSVLTSAACTTAGGTYRGDSVACTTSLCAPPPATGACCATGVCTSVTSAACATATGAYQGDNVACTSALCAPPPATGACCAASACSVQTSAACASAGGTYRGDNVACTSTLCAPPSYAVTVSVTGNGTVSSNPAGIACGSTCSASFPSGTQLILHTTGSAGWAFAGWSGGGCTGTGDCVTTVTGATQIAARFGCRADFNGSGASNVQDIFDFLAAWFTSDPRTDVNGANGINVQDIFDFLSAWFQGC